MTDGDPQQARPDAADEPHSAGAAGQVPKGQRAGGEPAHGGDEREQDGCEAIADTRA
jgi:hypothetical protein